MNNPWSNRPISILQTCEFLHKLNTSKFPEVSDEFFSRLVDDLNYRYKHWSPGNPACSRYDECVKELVNTILWECLPRMKRIQSAESGGTI